MKRLLNVRIITPVVFSILVLFFWQFGYRYTLFFQEPLQLFLTTGNYFWETLKLPAGFAGYLGEFFTQFYVIPFVGPLIILFLLLLLQFLVEKIFCFYSNSNKWFVLSYLPSVIYCFVLSDEFYLLSGLIAIIIATALSLFAIHIRNGKTRAVSISALIIVAYFISGGAFFIFLFTVLVAEFIGRKKRQNYSKAPIVLLVLWLIISIVIPVLIRNYYDPVPLRQAFVSDRFHKISTVLPFPSLIMWILIPALLWISAFFSKGITHNALVNRIAQLLILFVVAYSSYKQFPNPNAEKVKQYDYYVRHQQWEKIIELAEKDLPRNAFAVNYLNLALVKTNQLGNRLFEFRQLGSAGLFLPYDREHLSSVFGNEALYHVGLVNASQQYMFEGMEAIPDLRKSTRALKRLTDVAMINGDYALASKYIDLLKNTLFYKKWAQNAELYLYNELKINTHPDWGIKRTIRPQSDYFFSVHNIDVILLSLLHDNPNNRLAFEYLMSYYLLNKDLGSFMRYVSLGHAFDYQYLPRSCQEAVLYVLGLQSREAVQDNPYPINPQTTQRLNSYVNIYTSYPDAEMRLKNDFGDTFWYYFHYR